MGKRIIYNKGDLINGTEFIKDAEPHRKPDGTNVRQAIFICNYCGCDFICQVNNIKSNTTKSCGCLHGISVKKYNSTHGMSSHRLYIVWNSMKARCYNKNNKRFYRYGERGISISDEWISDFKSFYNFCINNGWKPSLQIDRIDNDGNYEPSNCRFVTSVVNNRNRPSTKLQVSDVIEIKKLLLHGDLSHRAIGNVFNVSKATITTINTGK